MAKRPNIVWVMPDEWRPDCAGFMGSDVVQTPNLDALAQRGVVFENAHCESPVCMSSRACLVTGRHVRDHGLCDNSHLQWAGGAGFPEASFGTFAQSLQRAGYHTAEIGKMHFRGPRYNPDNTGPQRMQRMFRPGADLRTAREVTMSYGFHEAYEEADKPALGRLSTDYTDYLASKGLLERFREQSRDNMARLQRREPGPAQVPEDLDPFDTLDSFIGRRACEWIRGYDRDDPFFLWVAPIGPHAPCDAPRHWSGRYDPASIPLGPLGLPEIPDNAWGQYLRWNVHHLSAERWTEEDYRVTGALYYGLCTQIDHWVGEIVRTLEETGRLDDTWFAFSSDHGELLGDHGLYSKRVFYNTSVKVPCLLVPPGGLSAPARVSGLTQGFDVTATFLDVAGASADAHLGRSLAGAASGDDVSRDVVFSEIAGFLMVFDGRHKLVLTADTLEPQWLHDLQDDPDERTDVLATRPEVVRRLVDDHARPFRAAAT